MKLDDQDLPFESFTYALSPLTDKLTPVDWKLLVTEKVESQHIRCHELQAGDNLSELIASFQKAHALAVVLINTSDSYILQSSFLEETQEGQFPVLVLTRSDGVELLKKVEQFENVFAQITAEAFVDTPMSSGPQQKIGNEPIYTRSGTVVFKEPGQCSMSQCSVRQCSMSQCSVGQCSVRQCSMSQCSVSQCSMSQCSVSLSSVSQCSVSQCSVSQSSVSQCSVSQCSVSQCSVSQCSVSQCSVSQCSVSQCRVSQCSVSQCRVSQCSVSQCS